MPTASDNFRVSAAGEYLTAAELSIRGWQVCMSPRQPSFDIAAVKGEKFHRVQVTDEVRFVLPGAVGCCTLGINGPYPGPY